MSEDNGPDCAESAKNDDDNPNDENCETVKVTESVDTEQAEPSANADKPTEPESAINDKESINSEIDEKETVYGDGANASRKGEITWTVEGTVFTVVWSLPEGSATAKDYIALCLAGT